MKKSVISIAVSFVFLYTVVPAFCNAQTKTFEISTDSKTGNKVLKGLLSRSDIDKDTSFKWFKQNYALGKANADAVAAFQRNAAKFQIVVFFGTWCEDSHNLLPVFFRLADKSGYAPENITLIGVDRLVTPLDNLNAAFKITNTPTFIVMKDGKEVGRVVEYGKYGQIDKELGEIVAGIE